MPEDLTQTQQAGDLATGASDSATATRILEVDNVTLRFGGVVALNEVSFHINEGEILGLIGPNGAGKTTCFNVMTLASRSADASGSRSPSSASPGPSRTSASSAT